MSRNHLPSFRVDIAHRVLTIAIALACGIAVVIGGAPANAAGVGTPVRFHQGASPTVDVIGDDERDVYVGTGGLILPDSVGTATQVRVATCPDCHWRLAEPCATSPDGRVICLSVVRGCPQGRRLLIAWFSEDGGATWENLGVVCIPPTGPTTVASVGQDVVDEFTAALPGVSLTHQPAVGIVTQAPVLFDSGQPHRLPPVITEVAGRTVVLEPVAHWLWEFGDGAALETDLAGSRYPDMSVSHTYRRSGRHRVGLTTTWTATFTIDDLGPFTVSQTITQHQRRVVTVGQARAVLVP